MRLTYNDFKYMITESIKRILRESEQNDVHPAVYVGTYGKYNNGSLEGGWVDLTQFSSKEEFLNYCYQKLHANERSPELMFQDYEYIPQIFISESSIDGRFWDFMNDDSDYSYDIKCAVANHVSDVDEYFNVIDDIHVYYGCDDMTDVAYQIVDDMGMPQNLDYYFDYETFGRDCSFDGPSEDSDAETVYDEYGVSEGDDTALGETIVDNIYGGVEHLDKQTLERYFDYEAFGRALESDGTWISSDDGMIELY